MINWCKQNTLFLLITSSFWGSQSFRVADSVTAKKAECHSINSAYEQVHGFETEEYYINICQLDGSFYYYRQSKLDSDDSLVVPAEALVRGDIFQAQAGKTTYFVGKDSDRYYSSVMSNDNEILFEPEIPSDSAEPSSKLTEVSKQTTVPTHNRLQNVNLDLNHPQIDSSEILVCTKDNATFYPHFDSWQKLVGKSIAAVSKYAVKHGYNFSHAQDNPHLAWIVTQEGTIVNLSLTSNSQTQVVEQVCLPAVAKNKE